jgi:hypothetical protein
MEYVYHMLDPKRALSFLRDLHGELTLDSGVIFLRDNKAADWHVFVKSTESLTRQHTAHGSLLTERDERSEYSLNELSTDSNKAFMSSGTLERITASLGRLW